MPEQMPIGGGTEKHVTPDLIHPERVIKRYHEQRESEQKVRARFYLGKICHALWPKNFPDMHQSGSTPNQIVMEKVSLDDEHRAVQDNLRMAEYHYEDMKVDAKEAYDVHTQERIRDSRVVVLIEELEKMDIVFDAAAINFAFDETGTVVYVDNLQPWSTELGTTDGLKFTPEVRLNFNADKVRAALSLLPDASEREQQLRFLDRLVALYQIDRQAFEAERKAFLSDTE